MDDGFKCHGCPNTLKDLHLNYSLPISWFLYWLILSLLSVPPENVYGMRTQFSCSLDGFNTDDLEAVSTVFSCLDINLRFFPVLNLQSNI